MNSSVPHDTTTKPAAMNRHSAASSKRPASAQDLDGIETDLGAVTLMTLHAAKGLEFPCVYIIGVEQNLIPHERSLRNYEPKEIEEERRLLFVGITRAEHHLVMTHTCRRDVHGRELSTIPSDFLNEMPFTNVDCTRGIGSWSQDESQEIDVDDRLAAPSPKLAALKSVLPRLTTGAALEAGTASGRRPVGIPCRHDGAASAVWLGNGNRDVGGLRAEPDTQSRVQRRWPPGKLHRQQMPAAAGGIALIESNPSHCSSRCCSPTDVRFLPILRILLRTILKGDP